MSPVPKALDPGCHQKAAGHLRTRNGIAILPNGLAQGTTLAMTWLHTAHRPFMSLGWNLTMYTPVLQLRVEVVAIAYSM